MILRYRCCIRLFKPPWGLRNSWSHEKMDAQRPQPPSARTRSNNAETKGGRTWILLAEVGCRGFLAHSVSPSNWLFSMFFWGGPKRYYSLACNGHCLRLPLLICTNIYLCRSSVFTRVLHHRHHQVRPIDWHLVLIRCSSLHWGLLRLEPRMK